MVCGLCKNLKIDLFKLTRTRHPNCLICLSKWLTQVEFNYWGALFHDVLVSQFIRDIRLHSAVCVCLWSISITKST